MFALYMETKVIEDTKSPANLKELQKRIFKEAREATQATRRLQKKEEVPQTENRKFFEVKEKMVYDKKGQGTSVPLKKTEYYEKLPTTDTAAKPYVFLVAKSTPDKHGNIDIVKVPREPTRKFNISGVDLALMKGKEGGAQIWDSRRPPPPVEEWLKQNV